MYTFRHAHDQSRHGKKTISSMTCRDSTIPLISRLQSITSPFVPPTHQAIARPTQQQHAVPTESTSSDRNSATPFPPPAQSAPLAVSIGTISTSAASA